MQNRSGYRKTWGVAALLVAALIPAGRAPAATTAYTWNGGNGDFSDSAKWTPLGFPSSNTDSATFNDGSIETVTFTANATSGGVSSGGVSLAISNATDLTFNLAGFTYSALSNNNVRAVGAISTTTIGGAGTGLLASSSASGGVWQNFNGSTTGSGTLMTALTGGATLTLDTSLGFGILWRNDGDVRLTGNNTALTVDGNGSVMTISRGGVVTGASAGGSVSVTVSDGGVINSANTDLGSTSPLNSGTSNLTVTGTGSRFTHTGTSVFFIGRRGVNTIDILNGGQVTHTGAGVALLADALASTNTTVNLSGAGSHLSLQSVFIGGSTTAASGVARVNVDTGTTFRVISATGVLRVWDRGLVNLTGGTIQVADGRNIRLSSSTANHGTLRGYGVIEAITGSTLINLNNEEGYLRPGDTTATPAIGTIVLTDANFNQSAGGTTFFDFNSYTNDRILMNAGAAVLDGTVNFALADGYVPMIGHNGGATWDFITAPAITYNATDNIASLFAGWIPGVHYEFGVVNVSGGQALRLHLLPEPGSVAPLGIALVMTLRRRHGLAA